MVNDTSEQKKENDAFEYDKNQFIFNDYRIRPKKQ